MLNEAHNKLETIMLRSKRNEYTEMICSGKLQTSYILDIVEGDIEFLLQEIEYREGHIRQLLDAIFENAENEYKIVKKWVKDIAKEYGVNYD